jgi:hypothetical protein
MMDWTRLLNGVLNQFLRRFMNTAINRGIDHFAGGGKDPKDMTPAEREQAKAGRDLAQRAKQVRKATRRLF